MMDFYEEINTLVNEINKGKVNKQEANQRIKNLKETYGDDVFPSFEFEKKPKPWTKAYFYTLQKKNMTGACSEEFILHMAEVGDYLSLKRKKSIVGIAVMVILIILVIMVRIFR